MDFAVLLIINGCPGNDIVCSYVRSSNRVVGIFSLKRFSNNCVRIRKILNKGNMFKKKFFKSFLDDESDNNGVRNKFIQNRIKLVEKHIPQLEKAIFNYTDKIARSRDCVDKIAEILENYAKAENLTTEFKLQIGDFANVLVGVATKQDIHVESMETKVLEQFSEHENLCRNVQPELKLSAKAKDKERNWVRHLQKLKESQIRNPVEISLAEAEVLKAKGESARSCKNLQEQMLVFERKRLNAMKETLLAWSLAELYYHSKALELFTEAYRIAANIDVNADLEEFRNKLISATSTPR